MSKESVDDLFDALYRLTDLRGLFRKTAPDHNLSEEQVEEVEEIIDDVRARLDRIEEDMLE